MHDGGGGGGGDDDDDDDGDDQAKVPETQGTLEIDTNSRATHFVKESVCPGLRG